MFDWMKEKQARYECERRERVHLREVISTLEKQMQELNHDIRVLYEVLMETHSTYAALLAQMTAK